MKRKLQALGLAALLASPNLYGAVIQITDESILPDQDVTWTRDNVYVLNGFVFVEEGSTLTIEPGTVIKGKEGIGEDRPGALIISPGGKIFAEGTPTQPIIFTAEADELNGNLGPNDRGLWGGVIVLGRARLNSPVEDGVPTVVDNIEGIPVDEPRGIYGGTDDDDNSGVLRYVSIRHGGDVIGSDNEINGLTLGGVGRGTTVEFIEVFANVDDGIEWFGGTVDGKYLVVAFCGDDSFDYDQGWRGHGQFWFSLQDANGDNAGEHDGDIDNNAREPISMGRIYNATYIGAGVESAVSQRTFLLSDNVGSQYYNSVFTDFGGGGLNIANDAVQRVAPGDIDFRDNLWWGFGNGTGTMDNSLGVVAQLNSEVFFTDTARNNQIVDPQLRGISRVPNGGLDPRPGEDSPALTTPRTPPNDGFYSPAPYMGAFNTLNWATDWTALGALGYLTSSGAGTPMPIIITSETEIVFGAAGNTLQMSVATENGKTYQLLSTLDLGADPIVWSSEGAAVAGDGTTKSFDQTIGAGDKYFRIQVD